MEKDPTEKLHKFVWALEETAARLRKRLGIELSAEDVEKALALKQGIEESVELLDHACTTDEMFELLRDFNFELLEPEALETVNLKESILPSNIPTALYEEKVKHRGEVWIIRRTDSDPLPSSPHAHNDRQGIKMDLGTGDLYRRGR